MYRETSRNFDGPCKLQRTTAQIISVRDGKRLKIKNISALLLIEPDTDFADLKHNIRMIQENDAAYVFPTHVKEVLKKSDPDVKVNKVMMQYNRK